jgi:hypothetical protein
LKSKDREESLLFGLREDEKMGETYRGSATQLTEERTDQMIVMISIGLVLALVVGGFVVAAHSYGDQKQEPTDNNQQNIVIDYFDPAGTAPLQALREPDFVMESERSCLGPFYTVQGNIDFYEVILPTDYLPLCINTAELANYYVDVVVLGGYTPADLGSWIDVCQKDDYKGRIYVQWTERTDIVGDCCETFFHGTFYVVDDFCLDSSQYPAVNAPWTIDPAAGGMIPDKEVYFRIHSEWSGCTPGGDQDFTIIHSHSHQAFSEWIILISKTNTFCKHLKHKQSTWCYNQTALVQDIFEPKKAYKGGVILGPSTSSNI